MYMDNSSICKEHMSISKKNPDNPIFKILSIYILKHFAKETQMVSLIIEHMQIKFILTYHTHSLDWQKFKNLTNVCADKAIDEWEILYTAGRSIT